ncbi:MAG TPA: cyclase family protein [Acidimicrobiales bacterium]|nr:cyclase family protein [Acidimicrobiales bacterium]
MADTGNWGRWGADDQRGALNLVDPPVVLEALSRCRTGKVYSLAIPIGHFATPQVADRPLPERLTLSAPADAAVYAAYGAAEGVGANEDMIMIPSHAGTHIDALCHVFSEGTVYNGHPATSFTPKLGASKCGIDQTGSFAGRAVLLDVAAWAGEGALEDGRIVTSADLESTRSAQGTEMLPGDILIVRTGWLEAGRKPGEPSGGQPGLGLDAVDFIADNDVAVVGSDNSAVEAIPFDRNIFLAVHIELLVKLGVTLIEHLWLAELAGDRCYESLLVVGALPVTGATGSPINPIAIG